MAVRRVGKDANRPLDLNTRPVIRTHIADTYRSDDKYSSHHVIRSTKPMWSDS